MITKFLPTFKVVEVNNLTGLRNGHLLSQFPPADSLTKVSVGEHDFYENGIIMSLSADGELVNYTGQGVPILHYTEELNTFVSDLKYFAVSADDEFPRGVSMYIGDTYTTNNFSGTFSAATKFAKVVNGIATLQTAADEDTIFSVKDATLPDGSDAVELTFYRTPTFPADEDVSTHNASASAHTDIRSLVAKVAAPLIYDDYEALITALNAASDNDKFAVGKPVYVEGGYTFYIAGLEVDSVPYTYTTDADFIEAFEATGTVQTGTRVIAPVSAITTE